MRRSALAALLSFAATRALAHPSVVPHSHPHEALPSWDGILLLLAVAALAIIVLRGVTRGER